MEIVPHDLRLHADEPLGMRERPREIGGGVDVAEIAEMMRYQDLVTRGDGEGRLQVAADGEDGRWQRTRKRERLGRIAPCAAEQQRTAADDPRVQKDLEQHAGHGDVYGDPDDIPGNAPAR